MHSSVSIFSSGRVRLSFFSSDFKIGFISAVIFITLQVFVKLAISAFRFVFSKTSIILFVELNVSPML